jgi:hypothetical protein
MVLRADLEAKVKASEAAADSTRTRVAEVIRDVDRAIEESNAIPIETFDAPSVVRHAEDMQQTARRARRETGLRQVAQAYTTSRPRPR